MKTNASTMVLCRLLLTDRRFSKFSLDIVLKQERLSYDVIAVSEYDALLYVKLHLRLDRIRWVTEFQIAGKRERASMNCTGAQDVAW